MIVGPSCKLIAILNIIGTAYKRCKKRINIQLSAIWICFFRFVPFLFSIRRWFYCGKWREILHRQYLMKRFYESCFYMLLYDQFFFLSFFFVLFFYHISLEFLESYQQFQFPENSSLLFILKNIFFNSFHSLHNNK